MKALPKRSALEEIWVPADWAHVLSAQTVLADVRDWGPVLAGALSGGFVQRMRVLFDEPDADDWEWSLDGMVAGEDYDLSWRGGLDAGAPEDASSAVDVVVDAAVSTRRDRWGRWVRRVDPAEAERVKRRARERSKWTEEFFGSIPSGVRVRFYEHGFRPGGEVGRGVAVLNGFEVFPVPVMNPVLALRVLALLSVQNVLALSVALLRRDESHAVAVWSDAGERGLGWGGQVVAWDDLAAMTAPHHGSANPEHWAAYHWREVRASDLAVVVAAGGRAVQDVLPEFLAVPHHLRACTRCRHVSGSAAGDVVVFVPKAARAVLGRCACTA